MVAQVGSDVHSGSVAVGSFDFQDMVEWVWE
jgi:hypothetical protein